MSTVDGSTPTIIVSVDDAEPTASVDLRVAAAEARRRGAGIRAVHGCATLSPAGIIGAYVTDERLRYGQYLLTQAVAVLHRLTGGEVEVSTVNSADLGADALLAEAGTAALIVVLHTRSALVGPVADSTAGIVAARARCPVLVLHPDDTSADTGDVLVAADDLGNRADLLHLAAAEALRRGVALTVVHSWQPPADGWADAADPGRAVTDAAVEDRARDELSLATLEVAAAFPTLTVTSRLLRGPAVDVLVAASEGAAVLVVGRPQAAAGPALNGTAEALISRAHCPLLVLEASGVLARARP